MTAFDGPPILFVDLDGTTRHGKDELGRFVNGPDDVVVFPEAVARMRAWRAARGMVVAVTNQAGVALGHIDHATHRAIMLQTLVKADGQFDDMLACLHAPDAGCWCRKPAPGMLLRAVSAVERVAGVAPNRTRCLMVGDRDKDLEAARAAGVAFMPAAHWRAGAELPVDLPGGT